MSLIQGSDPLIISVENSIGDNSYKLYANKFDERSKYLSEFVQDHKISALLSVIKSTNAGYFLDLGANYGEFSIPISFYVQRLIAVEANPLLISPLHKGLREASDKNSCVFNLINTAVSVKKDDYTEFCIDPYNSSGGKELSLQFTKSSDINTKLFNVRAKTVHLLDLLKLCDQTNGFNTLDLVVKIDIEGGELYILAEYIKLFAVKSFIKPPLAILFEYNSNSSHVAGKFCRLISTFLRFGYDCYLIHPAPGMYRSMGGAIKLQSEHELLKAMMSPWEFLLVKN